ncbi:hypothetical protein THAOC_37740, partial [Thalassiosira oceanica]
MVGANGQRLGHPFLVKGGRHIGRFRFQRGGHAFRDRSSPKWSKRWSNDKKAARRANCDQVFDHFCNCQTPDREIFDQKDGEPCMFMSQRSARVRDGGVRIIGHDGHETTLYSGRTPVKDTSKNTNVSTITSLSILVAIVGWVLTPSFVPAPRFGAQEAARRRSSLLVIMSAKSGENVAMHWFRKGLRLHDNPALLHALSLTKNGGSIFPVYVVDPNSYQLL